jgi:ATP-binding cassette subfamily B protein
VIDKLLPRVELFSLILVGLCGALLAIYVVSAGLNGDRQLFRPRAGRLHRDRHAPARPSSIMQKLSFRFFDNHKTGHLITHVTKDLEDVGELAHHGPEDSVHRRHDLRGRLPA